MTPPSASPAASSASSPREMAAIAAALYPEGPLLLRSLQRWRPYICPFGALVAQVPAGASVLDVGCGGGLFLGLLHAVGRLGSGYGFDTSAAAIRLAQMMATRVRGDDTSLGRLLFEQRDAAADWPEGRFDVVSLIDVMHHVPPAAQESVLRRAAERVAPGGRLLYKDMALRPWWRAQANRLHDLLIARQWIHFVPVERVDGWAEDAGLEITRRARIDMLWYGHELRVYERPAG